MNEKKWEGALLVPISDLVQNSWNPSAMSDLMFNQLVTEIERDGFDEPILVSPLDGGKYRIVNGEHRYRAAAVLGLSEVPVVVKATWSEEEQMIKTVRRNMLHGELDGQKFNKLVGEIVRRTNGSPEAIATQAVVDPALAKKMLDAEKKKAEKVTEGLDETRKEIETVDDLSFVLRTLIQEYGETVPYDFLFFIWKQKMQMMVRMDTELKNKVDALALVLKERKITILDGLKKAIDSCLKELDGGTK